MPINLKASIYLALFWVSIQASGSELNLNFLQGEARHNLPDILKNDITYPSGKYLVDVVFNHEQVGRRILTITSQDNDQICFSKEWLEELVLPIKYEDLINYWDKQRACYVLEQFPGVQVKFSISSQELNLSIPQILLKNENSYDNWDYGIPGFRMAYNVNVNKTSGGNSELFGSFDANLNAGKWVLSAKTSAFNGQGFTFPEANISRSIGSIRGKFLAGKSIASGTLIPSFGYYGAALVSNRNMIPWQTRGYAPIISGVANTNARITIKQGEHILSSQIVPPGPYSLNNISPVGNGHITVIIEEEDGLKSVRTYPVTTMPTLLRANDFNYSLVVGSRVNDNGKTNGDRKPFAMASVDYGFTMYTMNLATILHSKYQNVAIGATKDLGRIGAFSASLNASRAKLENNTKSSDEKNTQTGISVTAKYAKGLSNNTNLQLITYQYTGKGYIDFNSFDSNKKYENQDRKSRYEAIITHNFNNSFLNFSLWRQDYRSKNGKDIGANISFTTSIKKDISLSLSSSYEKSRHYEKDDYSVSMSVSVPFSIFETSQYSTSSIGYSRSGKTIANTGISGSVSDRINYSLNASYNDDNQNISGFVGLALDSVQTGASISKNNSSMSASLSASGSVIVTQHTGLLFSREQNDTVAVVKLNNVPNVHFGNSPATNKAGNTALYVTPYNKNNIRIETENIPDNIELFNSIYNVVPTEKAIVYREFKHTVVNRYILRPTLADGELFPIGSLALNENGEEVGFVSTNGILLINIIDNTQKIIINKDQGNECQFSLNGITPGENKIKEINCE